VTFDDFMSARDLKTGESFRRFAARTGMSVEDIEAGYRWQQRIEHFRQSAGKLERQPA